MRTQFFFCSPFARSSTKIKQKNKNSPAAAALLAVATTSTVAANAAVFVEERVLREGKKRVSKNDFFSLAGSLSQSLILLSFFFTNSPSVASSAVASSALLAAVAAASVAAPTLVATAAAVASTASVAAAAPSVATVAAAAAVVPAVAPPSVPPSAVAVPAAASTPTTSLLVPLQPADDPHEKARLRANRLQVRLRKLVDGLLGEPGPQVAERPREPAVDVAVGDPPFRNHLLQLAADVVEVALLRQVGDGVAVIPTSAAAAVGVAEAADDAEQETRLVGHARERRLAEPLHGEVGAFFRKGRERVVRRGVDVPLAEVALRDEVLEVGLPLDRGRLVVVLLPRLVVGLFLSLGTSRRSLLAGVVLGVGAGAGAVGSVAAVAAVGARAGAGALCCFFEEEEGEEVEL